MKICNYCGLENEDDCIACKGCGTDEFSQPKTIDRSIPTESETAPAPPSDSVCPACQSVNPPAARFCAQCGSGLKEGATPPTNRWTPSWAWLSVAVVLALPIIIYQIFAVLGLVIPSKYFYAIRTGHAESCISIIVVLLTTIKFSGVNSLAEFREKFVLNGLNQEQCFGTFVSGFFLQGLAIVLTQGGFRLLVPDIPHTVLTFAILAAPFMEEPWMRGYIYASFRSRYSFALSTMLTVLIGLVTHLPYAFYSLVGFGIIGVMQVVLCFAREKTGSLWPCIAGHLAFNLIPALYITRGQLPQ